MNRSLRGSQRSVSQPDAVVPAMSRMPIAASMPAAVVAAIPWSCAAGMKCTAIRPTVVAPQTKKLLASAQNVPVFTASSSTATAEEAGAPTRGGSTAVPP